MLIGIAAGYCANPSAGQKFPHAHRNSFSVASHNEVGAGAVRNIRWSASRCRPVQSRLRIHQMILCAHNHQKMRLGSLRHLRDRAAANHILLRDRPQLPQPVIGVDRLRSLSLLNELRYLITRRHTIPIFRRSHDKRPKQVSQLQCRLLRVFTLRVIRIGRNRLDHDLLHMQVISSSCEAYPESAQQDRRTPDAA